MTIVRKCGNYKIVPLIFRQEYTRFLQRYKMLCDRTWPNYRGSEQDGVKLILQKFDLSKDVTFGNTKLVILSIFPSLKIRSKLHIFSLFQFVQSPESLFHLEGAREKHLPKIVIKLQKVWRGVMARRQYKKMKAALKIGLYYRHCVRRGYVRQLCSTFK